MSVGMISPKMWSTPVLPAGGISFKGASMRILEFPQQSKLKYISGGNRKNSML
jgi:hypothetical protein